MLSRGKNFSPSEDDYIKKNFRDMFDDEISKILNRPIGSITRRRQRLGCWHVQQEISGPLPGEIWKSLNIDGDYYQISNRGRIKAGAKLSSLFINTKGYVQWRVVNSSKNIAVSIKVHRAVAEAFCFKPKIWNSDWHVHHKDNNPQNNSSENLEWLSPEQYRAKH